MRKLLYGLVIFVFIVIIFVIIKQSKLRSINPNNTLQYAQTIIEQILDTEAEFFPEENVFKVSFPRNDIKVTIDNWPLHPFMGLSSWIAFQKGTGQNIELMAMGDVVLLEDEINPTMSAALDNSIQITALHNHFIYDNPKIYFMHLEAEGTVQNVAKGIYAILSTINNVNQRVKIPLPTINAIDGEPLERIISVKGVVKEGMFKIVIGRHIKAGCNCKIGKNMGINTWIAFGGTNDNAIIIGDFALLEHELQPVLKALRNANIQVVAIHNHMINEKPRMIFLHFWAQGAVIELAYGIKNVLDQTDMLKDDESCIHCNH
ncbi:MAG TPA: DUF1259 domain-containing protein [Candidatus Babeliales bacterium]|nr:DUF1259 domain-containing protein [Candidatus Babeliales bacterium]